jgi:DNA-binding transcriptional LysR family regulator
MYIGFDIEPPMQDPIERRLKLHDLRVLITVAHAGSMLKAARQLNTSQPAVSRSIAELEHALGVSLLERSRHGVKPTIYGQALLDCGTAVFDDLRQGVKNIAFLVDPTEGELRIGGDFPGMAGVIPAATARFRRKYPRIDIHGSLINEVHRQQSALRERSIDVVFGRLAEPFDKDLHAEILFEEGLVAVAGSHNPWTRRRKIQLTELVEEPWLLPALDTVTGLLIANAFRANGMNFPPKGVVMGGVLHMHSLIANGDFLGFLPRSLLRLGTIGLGVKMLPVNVPIAPSHFGILRLKNRMLSPLAESFIACAREIVKPLVDSAPMRRSRV